MKCFSTLVFLLIFFIANSQTITYDRPCYGISAGLDSSICAAGCVNVTRTAVPQHENRSTTSYLVQQMTMPSPAYNFTGTTFNPSTDDIWSGVLNIGFNFCFFGNTYNRIVIGANGCISFNTSYALAYCAWSFSGGINTIDNINNSILGPYTDIDIRYGGNVKYYTEGVAPCRRFVISYDNIAMYSCNSSKYTSQIVLHEGYNIIDVIVKNKPVCGSWNGGRSIIGIKNANGTISYTAPGNNPSTSAQSNVCYRFLPNGPLQQSINWTDANGNIVSNSDVLTTSLCSTSSNTFTANLVNNRCDGTTVNVTDAVIFKVDSLPNVSVNSPSICSGGTAVLTASGANTYSWTGGLGNGNPKTTPVLVNNTTYTVTGTNTSTGCSNTAVATVSVGPPTVTVNSPTMCIGVGTTLTASGADNYTWSNGSTGATISVNPSITTTYTVTGTLTGCATPSAPATSTVTVTPAPTVTKPADQQVCIGTNTASINFSGSAGATFTWTNNNPSIGLAASGIGNIPAFSTLATGSATITVTPQIGISCSGTPQSFTITVNPDASLSLTSANNNQTKCINTAITNIVYAIGGGGIGATVTGLPAGITGVYNAGVFTISGTPTATGTFNYTVTTTGTCVQKSLSGTITVNPDAILALTTANNNQTRCINNAIVDIKYSVGGGGTGATVTGLPAGVTGTYNAGVFTISGTPTATGTFNYTVTTTGTCVQKSLSGTLTVNPDAILALTTANNNQTRCINNAIVDIKYSVGGGGTGATVTGLPAGITGVYNAGVFTISGTPTATGTFNYTVTTTGTCVQKSLSGTLTVNPDATLALTTANNNQTRCINIAITNIAYAIGGGGTGATVTGLPAGITGVYNAGVFTISGTPTATGTFNYTVTTTGTCVQKSLYGTITVNPDATLSLTTANNNQTRCINTAITSIVYAIGGGGTGATVTGLPAGITGVYNAGVFTISGTPTATGTFNYTVTTTGTCVQKSLSGTLTVNPDATLSLTTANNNQTRCINTAITNIVYAIGGGGTGATVTGLPAGVTGTYNAGVFTISGTPTATGTFNYTVTTTGTCVQKSLYGTITINPDATLALTTANNNQIKCINTAITNIVYSIGGGGTGATITGLPTGVTGTYNAGIFTISGTATATGTFNYTVTTTGTCVQKSLTGTITVNPDATLALTTANNNQTRCINNAIVDIKYSVGGGGTGATVTGLPTGLTGVYNAGVFTISGTPTATGTFNYTVTSTGGICVQKTLTGTITVNPDATLSLTTANNNQTKCINTAITNIVYSIGGGGTGATITGLPTGVTGVYNAGVFTISGTPTATGTFNYTVTTTGTCVQKSLNGTIVVNPDATLSLTTSNNNQTKCINTAIANIVYAIGGDGTGATITGLPTGVTEAYNAGVFTISGTPTATGTFNYTVTSTGGTCVQKTLSGTITVNPDATLSLTTANNNQTKCINTAITNIVYAIGGGGTGAAVTGLPTGVTGVYNAGVFTISGTPTATGTFNYTVTTTGTCVQKSLSGTITVNPDATLALTTSNNNQTKCINTAITNIVYAIGGDGTGATVTGLPAGITGVYNAGVFTISGTPTAIGTFNYTVTSTGGTCVQKTLSGIITVNPDATLVLTTSNNNQTKCINNAIVDIKYSIGGGGTGATVTGLPAGVTGAYNAGVFTISGSPTATGTFNYTVNTSGTCVQKSLNGTIVVNPDATLALTTSNNNQTKCINTAINNIVYAIGGGGTGATVTGLPTGVTGVYNAGVFTISGTPTVSGTFNYTVTTTGTCVQKSLTGIIKVDPIVIPTVSITALNNDVCPGSSVRIQATVNVTSTYQWYVNSLPVGTNSNIFSSSSLNNGDVIKVVTTTVVACTNPNTATSNTVNAIVNTINYTKPLPVYCINDSFLVDTSNMIITPSPNPNFSIKWTNGSTITTDSTINYMIRNTSTSNIPFTINYGNNCKANDVLNVKVNPLPSIDATVDIPRAKYEEEVQFDVVINNASVINKYNWLPTSLLSNDSIRNPTSIITASAMYYVTVRDNNSCVNSDSVFVELINECREEFIYVPSGFSPNNDGINDCFSIMSPPKLSNFKMVIFDRWSEKVFETNNTDDCWDGTYKGVYAQSDSYAYIISYVCYNGTPFTKKGTITIVR